MLSGYGTEGFLNKDVSVGMNEWNHPISEKSNQKTPLKALPYGLPIGSPLFTKNGIGLEWSKSRMQQYDDVWDTSKCRGMGGRGSGTDARGLGYPEYIQDLETKESLLMARTKGRGKKLEGEGKKTISQPDANTGVIPPAPYFPCETPQAHTLLGKRKAKNKSKCISGFIFMCNARTKPECYRYRVLGLPAGRREDVEKVKKGIKLFLFDVDVKLLYGVYVATSVGQMNLEPYAFAGKFPAQVSFAIYKECLPLHETVFKSAIRDNYEGNKFKAELTHQQVKDLLSLFPALTVASVASVPQVAPSQAIRHPVLADKFQPSSMLPPQNPCLAGAQPGYAAPIVGPHAVQRRVLNDPYYFAESQRPRLAEDNAQITRDPYSRYVGQQQMAPCDQFANIAAGYHNTYPTTATSHGPKLMHIPHVDIGYNLQRENVAGYYPTYPIPATSLGPPLVHQPHVGREFDQQREDVARSYVTYPVPATSQGPPVMHHLHGGREFDQQREDVVRSYTTFPIPATSQGPPVMHAHEQFPRMPMGSFPVSSNYFFDGTKQGYR